MGFAEKRKSMAGGGDSIHGSFEAGMCPRAACRH